jgi:prepilin-type N-terminal cleavage/methylation domain-containing protein
MKTQPFLRNSCDGFTIFEIIITLVIMAIAGLMLTELTGTSLTKSMIPLQWTREEFVLKEKVEQLTADYVEWVNGNNSTTQLSDFKTIADGYSGIESHFITFPTLNTCSVCDATDLSTGTSRNLKVTVSEGNMKAVVIFSDMKNDPALYINF